MGYEPPVKTIRTPTYIEVTNHDSTEPEFIRGMDQFVFSITCAYCGRHRAYEGEHSDQCDGCGSYEVL